VSLYFPNDHLILCDLSRHGQSILRGENVSLSLSVMTLLGLVKSPRCSQFCNMLPDLLKAIHKERWIRPRIGDYVLIPVQMQLRVIDWYKSRVFLKIIHGLPPLSFLKSVNPITKFMTKPCRALFVKHWTDLTWVSALGVSSVAVRFGPLFKLACWRDFVVMTWGAGALFCWSS